MKGMLLRVEAELYLHLISSDGDDANVKLHVNW